MGLDAIELVMAYEDAFGIEIPDSEVARMRTPRDVVDFLLPRLGESTEARHVCSSARVFYRLRARLVAEGYGSREAIIPGASIVDLLGPDARSRWARLQRTLECNHWPRLRSSNRRLGWLGGVATVGEAAEEIGAGNPGRLHPEPWTRTELEAALMRVTESELGLEPGKFTVNSRYVEDMKVD